MKKIYPILIIIASVSGCVENDESYSEIDRRDNIVGLTANDYNDPCLDSDSMRKGVIFKLTHTRSSVSAGTYVNCYTSSGDDMYSYLTTGVWAPGDDGRLQMKCYRYECETDSDFCSCQYPMEW